LYATNGSYIISLRKSLVLLVLRGELVGLALVKSAGVGGSVGMRSFDILHTGTAGPAVPEAARLVLPSRLVLLPRFLIRQIARSSTPVTSKRIVLVHELCVESMKIVCVKGVKRSYLKMS
jgi:hypothetical protein